ncbi:MAG TPA: efflux RND transporter periplasmic adaptor subunit [Chitinophagaceae bacterium]|jgi:HlyD family secretion protein|nr:efflux RND transporter periplasmic adaptor subunit [Chitinophagaceae bacterium]
MDTALSPKILTAKRNRTIGLVALAVIILLAALWFLRSGLKTSVDRSEIRTAVVERGSIENTLNATGEIIPEFEQVLSSPIDAAIREVRLDAGSLVKAGDVILSLDKEATEVEYERLKFQVELKRNAIRKLQLDLNKAVYDTRSADEIKQLNISSLQSAVEDAKRLYKAGGGTRESIEQAELALKVANLEKGRLENEIRNKQQTMGVELREAEIAAAIEESGLNELARKLRQASIAATRGGVVTWVNKNIGSTITQGEALVRIADLGSFKIKGSISDAYLDQVKLQMPVLIRINDSTLRGAVSNINPSVQNGVVSFEVSIEGKNHLQLRPNLKVELFLVTAMERDVLRVRNGPAFKGGATQELFILEKDKAVRKPVNIGLNNFDYVQLKDGVKPGDVVIISDTKSFNDLREIQIKN